MKNDITAPCRRNGPDFVHGGRFVRAALHANQSCFQRRGGCSCHRSSAGQRLGALPGFGQPVVGLGSGDRAEHALQWRRRQTSSGRYHSPFRSDEYEHPTGSPSGTIFTAAPPISCWPQARPRHFSSLRWTGRLSAGTPTSV